LAFFSPFLTSCPSSCACGKHLRKGSNEAEEREGEEEEADHADEKLHAEAVKKPVSNQSDKPEKRPSWSDRSNQLRSAEMSSSCSVDAPSAEFGGNFFVTRMSEPAVHV
jgi:hypothetical protein